MKSKAPNQPDFGLQYDADGMILDPHPPLDFDPDAVSSMKRPKYDATTINVGYGRRKWVFGRKRDLKDGAYSPSSGRYDDYETAIQAARDFYEDPMLTEAEKAKLV